MQNKVVNIINFVRGVEPRREKDLITPILEEIKLNKKYGFENTFLLQYDAMMDTRFVELFQREKDAHMELGIWIEMARCLIESLGIPWEGRPGYDWDWYVNPGFLLAYTREQKEQIIDTIMEKFHTCFGYYPKSAGSWMLDSDSVDYMASRYGVEAFCICREQWGTDAYTLWGGYYNGPYFPSRNNILHPAQTVEGQLHVPVIRMLGPDPIYCYYEKQKGERNKPGLTLYTLEPSWQCGMNENWVEWYFRNFLECEDMGYNYTQAGQENSFGWPLIAKGLPMQFELLDKLQKEGKVRIEKMCETGRKFTEDNALTPATVYSALDDWAGHGNQSVWYSCKNYRLGLHCNAEQVYIRDLQKYDESYRDIYLDAPCKEKSAVQEALPMVDVMRFSDAEVLTGIYFGNGRIERTWREDDKFFAEISADGKTLIMILTEDRITVKGAEDFEARFVYKAGSEQIKALGKNQISYEHNGMKYALTVGSGKFKNGAFVSENGFLTLHV